VAIRRSIFLARSGSPETGWTWQEITDFAAVSESEAQKLKKISPAGTHHDGSVFLVE
jgi:hypothetical protein